MAVGGVLAETDISHEEELRHLFFDPPERALDDAAFVIGPAACLILFFGDSEKDYGRYANRFYPNALPDDLIHRHLEHARHGGNLALHLVSGADEQGVNEIVF